MAQSTSDYLVQRLHQWGVRRIYGYPGDGINGFLGALSRAEGSDHRIEFIQARHEEMAAFMACAHAKFTGEVGVCMATSGPGAIHLLNGLYDAKMDHQPVVAIVGQQATTAMGANYQQEVDLTSLFKDVAGPYVHTIITPLNVRTQCDRAMRIAKAQREVTCIIFPNDIQMQDMVDPPPRIHYTTLTGVGYRVPDIIPKDVDLRQAADILNQGRKVAMLVGAGALNAIDQVRQVAETLGAGVAKALLGRAVLADELPYVTGAIGLLGTQPSYDMMMSCDTLLIVGSCFPFSEFLPKEGQAKCVQIDVKARNLSLRYPADVPLHGDARLTLEKLLPLLDRKDNQDWRDQIAKNVRDWWEQLEARAFQPADPINPQRVFWELSKRLPDNCILAADSGTAANWFARDLKLRDGMMASLSGNLATMCPGVPYVIAAKFAYPDRVAIAMVGDGAMQMLGINGLITISAWWKGWDDPRLIVLVLNNSDLNLVTWEQRVTAGDPKYEASQNLPAFNYAEYARLLDLEGIRVQTPDEIVPAFDQALDADRPCVIDCLTDPSVPPIPPHITFEQARHYLLSMLKGDPDKLAVIKQSFRDVMSTWLPGSSKKEASRS
ncbi:MAG: thiamine pyrophosphate-requiring protein [Phycisphaeraceae bacterium]|nr:thiamine pyrophosphate-requiring protein [Phycisphaeraceae bacterium]